MRRPSILTIAVLALAGCAGQLVEPDAVSKGSLSTTSGILIGSFARNAQARPYYSQTFYFKNATTNEVQDITSQQAFNIFGGKTKDDFNSEVSSGSVFAFTLPAGKYVFHNFRLYQSSGTFSQNWTSKKDYAIPFEVHANATNYVGEIRLDPATGKNIFGMTVPAGGIWVISDQLGRDVELLKKLHPEVPVNGIVKVIPTKKEIFTPLVVLPSESAGHERKQER